MADEILVRLGGKLLLEWNSRCSEPRDVVLVLLKAAYRPLWRSVAFRESILVKSNKEQRWRAGEEAKEEACPFFVLKPITIEFNPKDTISGKD